MRNADPPSLKLRTLASLGTLMLGGLSLVGGSTVFFIGLDAGRTQAQTIHPLSSNDISWLFPAPRDSEDVSKLISMRDLTAPNPKDPTKRDVIWPDVAFQQFLKIAASPAAQVTDTQRINLPNDVKTIVAWHIAGIRFDAGAPGLSNDVINQFGQSPQIRLIVQPVTRNADGSPLVHDIAAHLVFGFTSGQDDAAQIGCFPRPKPDLVAFRAIVAELAELRTKLSEGRSGANKVSTSDTPLGVHPELKDETTAGKLREEMKALLERHLFGERLSSMAIVGVPADKTVPWIFLSMQKVPPGAVPLLPDGGFVPVHGPALDGEQFAQMLNGVSDSQRVVPFPHTNNLDPITCKNAALRPPGPPIAERRGSSTADVFANPKPDQAQDILDLIADPERSHFFNTDCVSCHTDTRLGMDLFGITKIPGVDSALLPNGRYNVRNFGWSPPVDGPVQATVTRRTASETNAVLNFINAQLLAK